jgi:ubiquinone/menaquinone biosynthesis C-methylase UbiE
MVGPSGRVDAIDINPVAVRHVKRKVEARHLTNVEVTLVDAGKTDFPDSAFDVAFLFGVAHALDLRTTLLEMHRLLKPGGSLSVEVHGSSEAGLLETMTKDGLFHLADRSPRVCRFEKGS